MGSGERSAGWRRGVGLAAVLSAGLAVPGCWIEGGRGYSGDSFTYISTEHQPKTVSVIDTRTGQTVWSYEVPVGRELVMEFYEGESARAADYLNPDILRWDDFEAGQLFGAPGKRVSVPPATARRIDVALRPAPESAAAPVRYWPSGKVRPGSAAGQRPEREPAEYDLTGR